MTVKYVDEYDDSDDVSDTREYHAENHDISAYYMH